MISAMRGYGRFSSNLAFRVAVVTAAVCLEASAQITSLQSSQNGGTPANVTSITGGSNLPNGFTLYVNAPPGTFNPQFEPFINWNNQGGGPSGYAFGSINADGSQISGIVTSDLLSQVVTSNVTVLVT